MNERVVIIAQARAGSTRLPRKAFRKLRCGLTPTEFLLRGLRASARADEIVLAVPDGAADNAFAAVAAAEGATLFRGSENDVLDRYFRAAVAARADVVVRVCGDNPLTDPAVIDRCVETFLRERPDYLNPAGLPLGTFGEVFGMNALRRAHAECSDPAHREHVTLYIYAHPERFRLAREDFGRGADALKVTIDTQADFDAVDALIERLGGKPPVAVEKTIKTLATDYADERG